MAKNHQQVNNIFRRTDEPWVDQMTFQDKSLSCNPVRQELTLNSFVQSACLFQVEE